MSAARVISEHHGGSRDFTSEAAQCMSDGALVAGAKMGHGSVFEELHNRHRERMFRVAHRISRHREDAQDAVQECFLSAYVHLKKFDQRARFSRWLTRIAINAALMKTRKNRVSREVGVEDAADAVERSDSVPNPEEICARTEQKAALRDVIAKLRPTLRNVVKLYDSLVCSPHETARELGVSVAAAKGRLFHARATLRRRHKKYLPAREAR
jgi:RNA polymerase sigma-70 factor (ECF subfamily)